MKQLRKQQEDDVLLKRINTLEVENDKLRAENERLREKLDDMTDYYRNAMREGAPDEVHCGCVPALRKEVDELREVAEAAHLINEGIRGDYRYAGEDPTVLKTWIRHDRISALRTALNKLGR